MAQNFQKQSQPTTAKWRPSSKEQSITGGVAPHLGVGDNPQFVWSLSQTTDLHDCAVVPSTARVDSGPAILQTFSLGESKLGISPRILKYNGRLLKVFLGILSEFISLEPKFEFIFQIKTPKPQNPK